MADEIEYAGTPEGGWEKRRIAAVQTCETCGTDVRIPGGVHICGRCATDWNDPDRKRGLDRINGRRTVNGLEALAVWNGDVMLVSRARELFRAHNRKLNPENAPEGAGR